MVARAAFTSVFLALTLGLACDKGTPKMPAVDTTAVRASVDSLMRGHFRAFEQSDLTSWADIFADDVFFTAADPSHVFTSRDSAALEMGRDLTRTSAAGVTLSIRPRSSRIWVDPSGRAAGATYELDYSVTYQNRMFPYQLRSAYLLTSDSGGWVVRAAQYSRAIPYDTLFMSLMSRKVRSPARVGGQVTSAAGEIVRQFRSDLRDISKASFAGTATVVTPGSIAEGGDAARRELAQWLGPAGNATEPGDGIRATLNASGTIGWVATNLHVAVFAGPESAIAPMRALFIYRLGESKWEIIQASLSVGWREQS